MRHTHTPHPPPHTGMFYEPVWSYGPYRLVIRPDTPNYYIAWNDPRTGTLHRRSTRTGNFITAQQHLVAFAAQPMPNPTLGPAPDPTAPRRVPEPHEVPIADVIAYYFERHMQPHNPSHPTARENLKPVDAFIEAHTLRVVSDLDPDTMDLYPAFRNKLYHDSQLQRMRQSRPHRGLTDAQLRTKLKDISNATVGRELSVLNTALRFYKKRNKITRVPFIQLPPPAPPRSRWLTPDEFASLYAAASTQRLRDFMLLAIHTLQRPRFLFDLRTDQIDLPRRRIEFLRPGERQTKKGRPAIRVSEQLAPLLERLIARSQSGYILEYNGQPITGDLRRSFNAAAIKAGLHDPNDPDSEPVTPYTLRHSGATWLAQEGVDLWQIAGMLGHRDTRMVERVYAKHHPDHQTTATAALDRIVKVHGEQERD